MNIRDIKFGHRREYRVFGLQRSGLHAVTNWIIASLIEEGEDQLTYLNFVNSSPDIKGNRFKLGNEMPSLPDSCRTPLDKLNGTLVLGFEEWDAAKWVRDLDTGVESVNVFVTRDLKDVFASRLARLEQPKSQFSISEDTLKVWGEWMTGTDPEGNYKMLKHYRKYTPLPPNTTAVKFENWISSEEYRRSKATKLGIEFHNLGMDKESKHGGGSSFEKPPSPGQTRWERYKDHPMMREFIRQIDEGSPLPYYI